MEGEGVRNFLKHKKDVKKSLATQMRFAEKKPLMVLIMDKELSRKDELEIHELLSGMEHLDLQVVILADDHSEAFQFSNTMTVPYSRDHRKMLLEAADMALCFNFNDEEEMLLNGTIPVSGERAGLKNYDVNKETGNAFIYKDKSKWAIFAAVVRAVETFKFPYDWSNIVRQGRESVLV